MGYRSNSVRQATILAALALSFAASAGARELTFEERIRAQEAIERVYYSHQLGTTKPFEEAMPRVVLEGKVRGYLRQSTALELFWNTPVTSAALDHELERIARNTRTPDRLKEIFDALNNDGFLVRECFSRPFLVDRLARSFYYGDQSLHSLEHRKAEELRSTILKLGPDAESALVGSSRIDLPEGHVSPALPRLRSPIDPQQPAPPMIEEGLHQAISGSDAELGNFPMKPGAVGPVVEEWDRFVVRKTAAQDVRGLSGLVWEVPKKSWQAWWLEVEERVDFTGVKAVAMDTAPLPDPSGLFERAPLARDLQTMTCVDQNLWLEGALDGMVPGPRQQHTAVWTGTEMIVWGGWNGFGFLDNGGRYDPIADYWRFMTVSAAPSARYLHSAVWTGSEMLVWGGYGDTSFLGDGGRYNPVTDSWSPIHALGAPSSRYLHTAVWTGSRMLVWGGFGALGYLGDGFLFDPAVASWTLAESAGAPSSRYLHTSVWTGTEVLVWGGYGSTGTLDSGAAYDPIQNLWRVLALQGAPSPRYRHSAVWTGSALIVWGGQDSSGVLRNGAKYDPGSDSWLDLSVQGAPEARSQHSAVWAGSKMLIWGGSSETSPFAFANGGAYNSDLDTWSAIPSGASARHQHSVVWTGSMMIVWGGVTPPSGLPLASGGRYSPTNGSWTSTSTTMQQVRSRHSAVWTGNLMIVWGGVRDTESDSGSYLRNGAIYDPLADSWRPTSVANAPDARAYHSAVWTGERMVVWGGSLVSSYLDTGGRYDPILDRWSPVSLANRPTARRKHVAVWAAPYMIVWGGEGSGGGRYDPIADTWIGINSNGPPSGSGNTQGVWTGSELIVWEGPYGYGARYDPFLDTWSPVSPERAPTFQSQFTMIWTGSKVLFWAQQGYYFEPSCSCNQFRNPFGVLYDPATDQWAEMSPSSAPASDHTAVWTGSQMLVWGGSGAAYQPATDAWVPMSLPHSPSFRRGHSGVWTGTMMIVFGGAPGPNNIAFGNGGRFLEDRSPNADGDGHTVCSGDCDDANALVYPGASQVCDGVNNDCSQPNWPSTQGTNDGDADGDGVSLCGNDCNESNPYIFPGAPQNCDGLNNDCQHPHWPSLYATNESDDDGDGYSECTGDCLDSQYSVRPGGSQICDGFNNDCNDPNWPQLIGTEDSDDDHDGFSECVGDCNDTNATVYRGAPQLCDGLNNDCFDPSWPSLPSQEYDADADGVRRCQGDCDDANGFVWATPGAVRDLRFNHVANSGATTVSWTPPLLPGGSFLIYDLLRSTQASNFVSSASCIETNDGLDTIAVDAQDPVPGSSFFYLVRAENTCPTGMGSLGSASDGSPRSGRECP